VAANADRRIVLITRRTRLEDLVAKYQTLSQAKFYVEHLGAGFSDYQREHETYLAVRQRAVEVLEKWGRYHVMNRDFLPSYIFAPADIVVALGQDGVVANTMKYLDGQPLIGVNPDPSRYDGILLPFTSNDLARLLPDVAAGRRPYKSVTMAKVTLSDGQTLHAVNDLFIGARSHTSALYQIGFGERTETQSSSGIIVSTGLGSTAWFKSIVSGSLAIAHAYGGENQSAAYASLAWDAPELRFAVREPFPSKTSQIGLVVGRVARADTLSLRSLMPENGVIFSDGIEADRLDFNAGTQAQVGVADRAGRLVV
jgi:NAD kinase